MAVAPTDIKARHLRRDPRAVLVVAEALPPFRGVELTCEAQLLADGVRASEERMAVRYLGEELGAAYAGSMGEAVIVRLEPGLLRAWDFADEVGAIKS